MFLSAIQHQEQEQFATQIEAVRLGAWAKDQDLQTFLKKLRSHGN